MGAIYRTSVVTFDTGSGTKTATITPVVGDLFVVLVANSGSTGTPTLTDDNTGGTYTQILSAVKLTSLDTMSAWVRDNPLLNTTSTIVTMTPGTTTGGGLVVIAVSGMSRTGVNAIRQSGQQDNQSSSTPGPSFPTAVLTSSMCVGAYFASDTGLLSGPVSWGLKANPTYITPAAILQLNTINFGENHQIINWTSASVTTYCDLIVELDASLANPPLMPSGGQFMHTGF